MKFILVFFSKRKLQFYFDDFSWSWLILFNESPLYVKICTLSSYDRSLTDVFRFELTIYEEILGGRSAWSIVWELEKSGKSQTQRIKIKPLDLLIFRRKVF